MNSKENCSNYQSNESITEWEGMDKMDIKNNEQAKWNTWNAESLTQEQREFLKERMKETVARGHNDGDRLPQEYYDFAKKVLEKMEDSDNSNE